ncbi:MAG: YceI family protein, partial [Myxococcota bacterium]
TVGATGKHVERHPTAIFSASAVHVTEGGVKVTGEFTLKGKSVPLELPLELEWSTTRKRRWVRARGSFVVDRFAIGIGYKTPFYIPNVDKEVEINIDVRAWAPIEAKTATVSGTRATRG